MTARKNVLKHSVHIYVKCEIPSRVYHCNDRITLIFACEGVVMILKLELSIRTRAERQGRRVEFRKLGDILGKLVWLLRFKFSAQALIAVFLVALDAKFTSIVHGGYARHSEQKRVNRFKLALVLENCGNTADVVVIEEAIEIFSAVKTPVFAAELAVYGMCDLKHIQVVEARIQALVALIIRYTVEHFGVHPAVIVAVERFAHQPEIFFFLRSSPAHLLHEIEGQAVRAVQADSVDVKLLDPETRWKRNIKTVS